MKKIVTEECPTFKCVVECFVEQVPVKIYRKVPCCTSNPACTTDKVQPAEDKAGKADKATKHDKGDDE
jgi:hypothetical protein